MTGQQLERFLMLGAQITWLGVEHTKCTEHISIGSHQWSAGIKSNLRVGNHHWIGGKPAVAGGIRHNEQTLAGQRVGTERDVARSLAHRSAKLRFEPLAILVYE